MSDTVAPQEGKFYRTRDGRKVGPMSRDNTSDALIYIWDAPDGSCWAIDGTYYEGMEHEYDLVAEWTEGPVVTETVKRIVEGRYGIVQVDVYRDQVVVTIDAEQGHNPTASQLREAAATLTVLADAL